MLQLFYSELDDCDQFIRGLEELVTDDGDFKALSKPWVSELNAFVSVRFMGEEKPKKKQILQIEHTIEELSKKLINLHSQQK